MTSVGIIGSGFGGIAMAAELLRRGWTDVRLWERDSDLGGVWRDNIYPGAACDVPSPYYSFSFAPHNPSRTKGWTRRYAEQPEILDYLHRVADGFGITPLIRWGAEVTTSTWQEDRRQWSVTFADGHTETVDVLVSAVGQLSHPAVPPLPGLADFTGDVFHTAAWPADYDPTGRTIAVIGSAATAVQVVPALAATAAGLVVLQRSPNHLWPKPDGGYPRWYGALAQAERSLFRLLGEGFSRGLDDRSALGLVHRAVTGLHLRRQVRDPELRAALTPRHPLGCKRILFSNTYYPALQQPQVQLVTAGIERVDRTGLHTSDGRHHEVDTLVLATGFASQDFLHGISVTGRDGRELRQDWAQGARAHLGMYVPGYPNLIVLYGPNTNLGGSSVITVLEAQAHHAGRLLDLMQRSGAHTIEATAEAEQLWDDAVQSELEHSPWAGCQNWYRHPASGRITSNWPRGAVGYAATVRRSTPAEFIIS